VIAEVANSPEIDAYYGKFNFEKAFLDGADFQKRIDANVAKHQAVLKDIGLIK
jgi:tripartite-type tricarboxylate transporter receptor subunit TctC